MTIVVIVGAALAVLGLAVWIIFTDEPAQPHPDDIEAIERGQRLADLRLANRQLEAERGNPPHIPLRDIFERADLIAIEREEFGSGN